MADNLPTIFFKGVILLFITCVVVFICFFFVLRVERYAANSELKRRGASPYTPEGKPNYWYYFVRDIPTIRSLCSLPFLDIPDIKATEHGFKVLGKDYEATYEIVKHDEVIAVPKFDIKPTGGDKQLQEQSPQLPKNSTPEPDYRITMIKGKKYFWEKTPEVGRKAIPNLVMDHNSNNNNPKVGEKHQPAAENTITVHREGGASKIQ